MAIINVGSNRSYTTINSAYSAASNGDTLLIDEGVYDEQIIMVNKLVNLVGNTAYPEEERVKIQAPNVSDYFTLWLEWNSTTSSTVHIEGLALYAPDSSNNAPTVIRIGGDSAIRVSGMDIVINKCVLKVDDSFYPTIIYGDANSLGTYRTANSVTLNRCDLYIIDGAYSHIFSTNAVTYWPESSRILTKSKLNTYFTYYTSGGKKYDVVPPYLDFIYTSKNYIDYGSSYGNYITPINNMYKFTGIIEDNGVPVSRELRIFREDNDAFITSTVSSGTTGYYEAFVPFEVYYYIICLDDVADPYYNDLIKTRCLPIEI